MPEYVVLLNAEGDDAAWQAIDDKGGTGANAKPVEASSPDAAINNVRNAHAELKSERLRGAHYTTVRPNTIKRMRRKLVESFELGLASDPDDVPAQGTLA